MDNQKSRAGSLEALERSDKKIFEIISKESALLKSFEQYHGRIFESLRASDASVYDLLRKEYQRQRNTIQLIAAENSCSPAVLAALGSVVQNKTMEGFVGSRFHGGSEIVDALEEIAISRAKEAFAAKYANVQPHSGTQANQIVITSLLKDGDRILSQGLDQGGHVSHGAAVSFTGKFFEVENYSVDRESYLLNYEKIREQALKFRPRLIICGATAYARAIDFAKFRQIADEAGAFLLADISHISGLVIASAHMSPVDYAHFTTTSTYKPGGPRGGLILMGNDWQEKIKVSGKETVLWKLIEKGTFPGFQGTPYLNNIAAKAVFFRETFSKQYRDRQFDIISNAKTLAKNLCDYGYDVLTGGTDNHMVLIDVSKFREGLTGFISQKCLEQCGIMINMNKLPYDEKPASVTSGMRLGTPIVTKQGMGKREMGPIAEMINAVLRQVEISGDHLYDIKEEFCACLREKVKHLCSRFVVD